MPCTIGYTGPAPVSDYFRPRRTDTELKACFRGRELTGWETELPAGYTGSILVPADSHSHPQGCSWVLQHEFKSLTRWTHGSFVGVENGTTRMLEWAKLASFVHAPVMPVWAEDAVVKPEGSPTQ
ncbi:hypothetical protein ACKKBG_A36010 [Auxenochlorella protothecoides x Auxenochlorella symbiontica]